MKKSMLIMTLVLPVLFLSGYERSGQNGMAENHVEKGLSKNVRGPVKGIIVVSGTKIDNFTNPATPNPRPRLFLILTNFNSKTTLNKSFLLEYLYANSDQLGC